MRSGPWMGKEIVKWSHHGDVWCNAIRWKRRARSHQTIGFVSLASAADARGRKWADDCWVGARDMRCCGFIVMRSGGFWAWKTCYVVCKIDDVHRCVLLGGFGSFSSILDLFHSVVIFKTIYFWNYFYVYIPPCFLFSVWTFYLLLLYGAQFCNF